MGPGLHNRAPIWHQLGIVINIALDIHINNHMIFNVSLLGIPLDYHRGCLRNRVGRDALSVSRCKVSKEDLSVEVLILGQAFREGNSM